MHHLCALATFYENECYRIQKMTLQDIRTELPQSLIKMCGVCGARTTGQPYDA